MLGYVARCNAMLCLVELRYAVPCYTMSCDAMLCYAMLRCSMLCSALPCSALFCSARACFCLRFDCVCSCFLACTRGHIRKKQKKTEGKKIYRSPVKPILILLCVMHCARYCTVLSTALSSVLSCAWFARGRPSRPVGARTFGPRPARPRTIVEQTIGARTHPD